MQSGNRGDGAVAQQCVLRARDNDEELYGYPAYGYLGYAQPGYEIGATRDNPRLLRPSGLWDTQATRDSQLTPPRVTDRQTTREPPASAPPSGSGQPPYPGGPGYGYQTPAALLRFRLRISLACYPGDRFRRTGLLDPSTLSAF